MTEPNEPKIVHFSPRAQAPVQDTAGNWEPDEQLFGLEELLQQLPPIRKLHLEKGRLTDLVRLYPDMKRTFDAPELLPEAVIASAMVRRRMELLLFRADDRREAGYALTEEEYAAKYFGMRCNEFLTRYGIADPAERERLRLRKIALYPAFFDTVRLNRPLWEFCRQFRAQGGRVWIVSTGSRANIDNAMRHLGITVAGQRAGSTGAATSGAAGRDLTGADEAWLRTAGTATIDAGTPTHATVTPEPGEGPNGSVDGILSGADVEHSKPAPDCFLEAMRREGCTPQETLIFEDSEIGLEAARRSGAAYFRVTL